MRVSTDKVQLTDGIIMIRSPFLNQINLVG